MLRRTLLFIASIFLLSIPSIAPAPISRASETAVQQRECVVYVTRTGERYHRESCGYLRRSSRPMSRSDAIAAGYTPCHRCGGSDCD